MQKESSNIVPGNFYKPSELLNIFRNFLSNKEINAVVLCLHGIYWKSDKIYGSVAFDQLKDENSVEEITIVVPLSLRENLKNGNLISVYGTVDRKLLAKGSIQILLNVTRIDLIKELAISEDEVKRAEFRRLKSERGYKNVDSILENKLFKGERPIIALIYAETSITNADFEKGLVAAKSYIDFQVYRVSFAKAVDIRTLLQQLDQKKYDALRSQRCDLTDKIIPASEHDSHGKYQKDRADCLKDLIEPFPSYREKEFAHEHSETHDKYDIHNFLLISILRHFFKDNIK